MSNFLLTLVVSVLLTSATAHTVSPTILPDAVKTPGDVLDVTRADICTPGYSRKVRDVPESVKRKVYASYGITSHAPHEYEIDHLISLELGGSNSIRNLWPESYLTEPYNAHVKDRLENRLHKLVCDGALDLKTAQRAIAENWIEAYRKYVRDDSPPIDSAKSSRPSQPSRRIIGNRTSHIYHLPGCPGYDAVSEKNRLYFGSVSEAESAGYRKAKNCR